MRTSKCFAVLILLVLASSGAQASVITYEMSFEFSGASPPEGSAPWLTATFDDGGTPGSVDFVLEATNLTDAEFVFESLFNFDPLFDVANLVFSDPPTKVGVFDDPEIFTAPNEYQANGDGYFDIKILFSHIDEVAHKFGAGESVAYTITSSDAITANSFAFLSEADGGGPGTLFVAAHVGGIGPSDDGSGWITVPEPATLSLIALGGFMLMRRRR